MSGLTIGTVAKQAGVNIETLRYYERKGIVSSPPRTRSNYRLYPDDTARRVRFIKRAQELGFSLKEIKDLLALRAAPGPKCKEVRHQARLKIEEIDEKIRTLSALKHSLQKLAAECAAALRSASDCPILDSLETNDFLETNGTR